MLSDYTQWIGNIDELRTTAYSIAKEYNLEDLDDIYSLRLVRDYVSRGLLGSVERVGKELRFNYEQLLRFIVVRIMLNDGWSLTKIQEQLSLSNIEEIEDLLPSDSKRALDTIQRLRASVQSKPLEDDMLDLQMSKPAPLASASEEFHSIERNRSQFGLSERLSRKARETSTIQREMKDALRKLNIPGDGPQMEDLKLIALAPWCQVLMTDERFQKLSVQEARDLGDALTASLTARIIKRGGRR